MQPTRPDFVLTQDGNASSYVATLAFAQRHPPQLDPTDADRRGIRLTLASATGEP